MERKPGKFKLFPKLESLEVYLLAADNPIGKRQFRPIFRRKRAREVLTREQVVAIKRGRRVLRREMKEQGIKRWIDFNVTATNLGLYFDRNRLLWPIFLWFMGGNTALKILATTAVLTTLITITEPLIEYITEYVTQYITQYVTEYVKEYLDKDRFTITVSDKMLKTGFELSETPDFAEPKEVLFAVPVTNVPCISISQLPHDIDDIPNNTTTDYFSYTFYCRYLNKTAEQDTEGDLEQYATSYDWGIRIHNEGVNTTTNKYASTDATTPEGRATTSASGLMVSDAIWVMVIQDNEVIVSAKADVDKDGNVVPSMLPTQEILESKRIAFYDRSIDYINTGLKKIDPELNVDNLHALEAAFGSRAAQIDAQVEAYFDREGIQNLTRLMLRTENWRDHYKIVGAKDNYNYYQVVADKFVSDEIVVERTRTGMLPWIKGRNEEYHKYTVVIWLEGDDPQCQNELMDGYIGLNFQIKGEGDAYMDNVGTATIPPETPAPEATAAG